MFQELSLCPNLTVAENVRVLRAGAGGRRLARAGPRRRSGRCSIAIFPGHGIAGGRGARRLSIAQRQMVEIAIAFLDIGARGAGW